MSAQQQESPVGTGLSGLHTTAGSANYNADPAKVKPEYGFYAAAAELAAQGCPVFPCKPSKQPYTRNGFKDATCDAAQITSWGAQYPAALVGVPTGAASGLFVLDVDVKNGKDGFATWEARGWPLPDTREHRTLNGGGAHYLFRHPEGVTLANSAGKLGDGLDTRADGGYVIWWPAAGGEVRNPDLYADVPELLLTALREQPQHRPRSGSALIEGQRNDTLFRLGASLRTRGLSAEAIEAALVVENTKCSPPLSAKEIKKIAESAGRYAPGGENLTDKGNARRLVQLFGEDIRYCYTLKKWLIWDGHRWGPDEDGAIMRLSKRTAESIFAEAAAESDADKRRAVSKHAMQSENAGRLQAAITLASSEDSVPIALSEMDADPWLVGVSNGVLDLRTGTLHGNQRRDYITKQTLVQFDPAATCPRWLTFLDQIMCGDQEQVEFLQKAIGYSLTGDTGEQCLFLLHGNGSNGKSTLLNVVKHLLGDYGMQVAPESLMVKRDGGIPNDIARLRAARFVATSETEDGKRLAEGLVKQLTGGDVIAARYLYGEFFEFIPQFKIWLAANHKPVIRGDDYAIWRRIHLIPFTATFDAGKKDVQLPSKLMAELPGILNWAVRGCLAWQKVGLAPPAAIQKATAAYRGEMDMVHSWIADCCVVNVNAKGKASLLYGNYRGWAEAAGVYVMSQPAFLRKLAEHGYAKKQTTLQGVNGVFYEGLGLLAEEEPAY